LGAGGEAQRCAVQRVIQRLDAETVARQEQRALAQVPDGEGEHAVEVRHAVFAPSMIGLEDHLAVAVGEEVIPHLLQFFAQLAVVVEGAVEYQRQMQRLVQHRLARAFREVDDG